MWLLHMEETDRVNLMHCRKRREYMLHELPSFSVNGYCPETLTVFEFFGCFYHGQTSQPFRDVTIFRGDKSAQRYEQTMSRLKEITRAGCRVKFQWECEFDDAGSPAHPIVQQCPLRTRDALYGGRTEAMLLYYKGRENETIHCRRHGPLHVNMQVLQVPRWS